MKKLVHKSDYLKFPDTSRREFLLMGLGAAALLGRGRAEDAGGAPKKECTPTEADIEGPFWRADAPFSNKLRTKDSKGDVLFVSGKVLGVDGCSALKDAIVDVWQADGSGHYDNEDEHDPKVFKLRGRMKTAADGGYEFETILPAPYKISARKFRPAHIHFKVSCDGFKPLTTQLYFKGDPHLASDPWAKKSNTMELVKHSGTEEIKRRGLEAAFYTCIFNVVLKKASKASYGAE